MADERENAAAIALATDERLQPMADQRENAAAIALATGERLQPVADERETSPLSRSPQASVYNCDPNILVE
jgi:hypothetical protein